jgi:hypothetical protein
MHSIPGKALGRPLRIYTREKFVHLDATLVAEDRGRTVFRWLAQSRRCLRALLTTLAFGAFSVSEAAPPAESFALLPVESSPVMSRDGHWLAWLERKLPKPQVIIFDLSEKKIQRTLTVPDGTKLHSLVWNDNETILITVTLGNINLDQESPDGSD